MNDEARIAVVGVGNPTMSDDGVGDRVVDVLHELALPEPVDISHAGTTAFLALEALSGADRGIVVDAVSDGDADPGAIHRYRISEGRFEGEPPDVFMHDFTFSEALQAGSQAYDLPDDIRVLGIEPGDTSLGLELSDPVAAGFPALVEAVLAAIPEVDPDGVEVPRAPTHAAVTTTEQRQTTDTGQ